MCGNFDNVVFCELLLLLLIAEDWYETEVLCPPPELF